MKRVKERRIFTNKETVVDNPYVDVEYCNSIFRKYIYAKGFEGGKQGDGTMLGVSPDGQYFMLKAYNDKYVMSAGNKEGGRFVPSYEWEGISTYEFDKDFEELKTLKGKDSKFEENIVKIESRLAETFEKTIKNLQKEGFLREAKSFDLSFTGKGINIKLNEMKEPTCFPCKLLIFDTIAKKNLHYKLNPKYNSNNPNSIYAMWDYDNTSNNDVILNNKDDFYKALHELYRYATDKVDPDYRTMKNWEWDFSGQLLCYGRGSYGQFEMKLINPESEPEFEDEEPSEEPFIDELYRMEEEYDIFNKEFYGKWPGSYAFYDEVLDNCQDTNVDYDDIKDSYEFTDYDIDFCLDYIRGEDGENVAKKIFGTVENVEKSLIEYLNDRNNENNAFKQFLDYFRDGLEHHEEEDWNEQVHSAAGDWDAWNYRDEDDDDDDDD